MNSFSRFVVLSFVFAVGCSSSDDGGNTPKDSGTTTDTGNSNVDSSTAETESETGTDSSSSETAAETSSDTAADTAMPFDTAPVCMPTGLATECNDSNPCPDGMRCYGFGATGWCAPVTPECGGFAMTPCPSGTICLRPAGSSLGFCADAEQRICICDKYKDANGCK
jgi:hypothetical protein